MHIVSESMHYNVELLLYFSHWVVQYKLHVYAIFANQVNKQKYMFTNCAPRQVNSKLNIPLCNYSVICSITAVESHLFSY